MCIKVRIKPVNMRRVMAERNMDDKTLIARLKISACYLSQLKSGIRNPSPKLRQRIMRVLGVEDFNVLFQLQH